jgi:hypothetical protein
MSDGVVDQIPADPGFPFQQKPTTPPVAHRPPTTDQSTQKGNEMESPPRALRRARNAAQSKISTRGPLGDGTPVGGRTVPIFFQIFLVSREAELTGDFGSNLGSQI